MGSHKDNSLISLQGLIQYVTVLDGKTPFNEPPDIFDILKGGIHFFKIVGKYALKGPPVNPLKLFFRLSPHHITNIALNKPLLLAADHVVELSDHLHVHIPSAIRQQPEKKHIPS